MKNKILFILVFICSTPGLAQPTITALSSYSGNPGATIGISGTNFNATPAYNIVYFGATQATVTAATTSSLTVTVPAGATFSNVSVDNYLAALIGYSRKPFLPTFNNSAYIPGVLNFDANVDFTTGTAPYSVAIGDIDGDGKPDLVVANRNSNTISVYRNTSSSGSITAGSFAAKVDFTTGTQPFNVAIGDLDGDGKPDLIVANYSSNTISVYRNTGSSGSITTGSFSAKVDFTTGSLPFSVAIGDIDGDGKPDLAVANYNSSTVSVFRNTSSSGSITAGSFAAKVDFTTGTNPSSVAIGDLDGDGKPDLAVANSGAATVSVLRNISSSGSITAGSFAAKVDFTTGSLPYSVAVGDIDGDGKPDLAVANASAATVSVLRNTSSSGSITAGSFAAKVDFTTGSNPISVAIGDIDGDGKSDLVIANANSNTISVYRNTSSSGSITAGSFAAKVDFTTGTQPYSVAIGDIDGDGKPDLAVANYGTNSVSVIRNNPLILPGGNVCIGTSIKLINTTGGTWASSNTAIGSVDATGIVTGLSAGTCLISYTAAGAGSPVSAVVTVNPFSTPVISSLSTYAGIPTATVTVTGSSFNTTAGSNIVFFGATQATVNSASATSLNVTIPYGDTYAPVSVDNTTCPLTAYSKKPFLPTYNNSAYIPGVLNFDANIDFTTGSNPHSVAIGDIDGDGKPDLVVANYSSNTISVYRNTSSSGSITAGSFAAKVDFTTGSSPYSVAIGDIDGDGKPDLAVANYNSSTVSVFRNTSSSGSITAGSFATKVDFTTGTNPYYVAIGDIDGDGKPDLAVANASSSTVSVFRNTSSSGSITAGSFAAKVDFTTGSSPYSVAIGDIDGDGKPDLAVTNGGSSTVSVLRNTSSSGSITAGSFAAKVDFTTGSQPYSVAVCDIDGDGKPDLAVANLSSSTVSVFRNTSSSGSITAGSFAAKVDFTTGTAPYSVAIGDIDGDGKPDLAVANDGASTVSVLRNSSSSGSITAGSFAAKVDFTTGTNPLCVAIGDIDGDGKPDLAVANYGSATVSVIRNNPLTLPGGNVCIGTSIKLFNITGGTWASSNTAIGSVDATGIVTGLSAGTCLISYTAAGAGSPVSAVVTVNPFSTPVISSLSTYAGIPTATVTVTGSSFNTTAGSNIVFFGATQATVNSASATSLNVTIPYGDTYAPVSVDNTTCPLTAYSKKPFLPTYNNSAYIPGVLNFDANIDFTTGSNPFSVAIGDIDGDGKPDLVVANLSSNTISVYRNTSSSGSITAGSFAAKVDFTTGSSPYSVAVGDIDGDGKPDLVVANEGAATVSVFRNTSSSGSITAGSFATKVDFTTGTNPYYVAIGDIDGDGKPDLAVANASSSTVSVFRNTSSSGSITAGSFAAKVDFTTGSSPYSVAIGDIDGDGKPDLAVANGGSSTVSALRNTSSSGSITAGSFAAKVDFTTGSSPYSVAIGDIDGDGKPDLAVANLSSSTVSVFRNTSSSGSITAGSFAAKVDFTTGTAPYSVAIGDIDGDGKPDLAVANLSSSTVSVFRNTSSSGSITAGSFAAKVDFTTGTAPYSVAIGDLDGDGKPDLAVANDGAATVSVIRNNPLILPGGNVCIGTSIKLINTTGGTWASSNTAIGSIDATGIVTGVSGGTCIISYVGTVGSSTVTAVVTVNPYSTPVISSLSTYAGIPTATVTVTGSSFNTTAGSNIVFFGATQATVNSASATSLNVTIPYGDTYAPVSVDNTTCPLTAYSKKPFLPTYNNSAYIPGVLNFTAKVDFTTGSSPYSVAIGDIDGDGKPDLVVANLSSKTISVYRNTSSSGSITAGSFAAKVDFTTGSSPYSVAVGDIDGDGKPDLVVANEGAATVSVFRNTSSSGSITAGSFATKVDFTTGFSPFSVAIGDIDGDGKPDLAVANEGASTVSVLRNTSSSGSITAGSFAAKVDFTTGTQPFNVAIGDIDGDGKPDLVVANYGAATVSVFRNTSSSGSITAGSFAAKVDFTTGTNPYSVAIGDIDGDGKPDLAVANLSSSTVSVFRNTSSSGSITAGSFAAKVDFTTGTNPYSVAIGDIDGDGKPDLAVANSGAATVSVFRNTSSSGSITAGSFAAKVDFTTGSQPYSVAIGDLDGDGKPDLAVANGGAATVSVIRNNPLTLPGGNVCIGTSIKLINTTGGTWASSNTAIGSVDATGIVTGVSSGTCIISYTAAGAGSPATSVVTVNPFSTPVISSLSTYAGIPTATVTVTGSSFNTTAGSNIVFFGATQATVNSASATALNVTIPYGDTYAPVSVDNTTCPLTAYSKKPFLPTYNNSAYIPGVLNFDANVDFTTGTNPYSVAIGDIDGDGKPDLVLANANSNTISVYRNTSSSGSITAGSFAAKVDFTTGSSPISVAIGDMDGDGKPDLVVANNSSSTVSVFRNTSSSGSITVSSLAAKVDFTTGTNPYSVAIGDVDGDGKPDLVVANANSNTISVYRNTSSSGSITAGSFAAKVDFTTGTNPYSVVIGDMDGDGKPDLAVANYSSATASILRNISSSGSITAGSFAAKVDFTTGTNPSSVGIGDMDGDGKPDLAVANYSSATVSVLRNTSSSGSITAGSFAAKVDFTTGTNPYSVAVGDMDGDGKPDLVVANYFSNTISVYRNTSSSGSITAGSFATKVDFTTGSGPRSVAIGDMDGDGKPDLAVANSSSATVSVIRNDPLGTITSIGSVCVGASVTLTEPTENGSWSTNNYFIATIDPVSGVVTGVLPGTAIVTYTVPAGFVTTIITVNAIPTVGTTGGNITVCSGTTATLNGTGATSYSWTGGITNGAAFTPAVGINTYTVTGTASGCSNTAIATVTVNALPTVGSTGGGVSLCSGGTATLSGTGATSYSWSGGITDGAAFTPALGVNTYTVTGSTGSCSNAATATITVNAIPTVGVTGGGVSLCSGTMATLNGTGASSYSWSGGIIDGAAFTPALGVNTYTVTGSTGSCSNTATATITVNALPTVGSTGGGVSLCSGATATLSGTGATSYSWSGGITDGAAFTPALGVNTYTVTGSTGSCSNTATATITVNALPTVGATGGGVSLCSGTMATLSGTGATSYSWSGGITDGAAFTPALGVNIYTVTGSTGSCSNTATATITVNAIPTVGTTGGGVSLCSGATATLSGTGATSYSWSGGITDGAAFTPALGVDTYTVTGSTGSCSNTTTATITVNAIPTVGVTGGGVSLCSGTMTTLSGTGATSYSWSGGITDGAAFTPALGVNTYTVTGTASGCSNTAIATVTVNAIPTVGTTGGGVSLCAGTMTTLSGTGATSYSWSGGITDGAAFTPALGVNTYTVTGTTGSCSNTATATITVNAIPTVAVTGGGVSLCAGTMTTLSGTGATSYSWSGGITDGAAFTPALGVNTYTVTGTTGSCSNTATATITVNAIPTVGVTGGGVSLCAGTMTTLSGTGATSYSWSGGITDGAAFTPALGVNTYTVTGTTGSCSNTATATITVNAIPTVGVTGGGVSLCAGTMTTLSGTGATSYSWSGGITDGAAFTPALGVNIYTVTGSTGSCSNTATATITVNAIPTVGTTGGGVSLCAGTMTTLSGTGATSYSWSGGITDGAAFTPALGVNTYTVTGTTGSCSNTATATITVNAIPTVGVTGGGVSLCSGATATLSGTGATSYSWSGGITDGAAFTPAVGISTYTVTGTASGCSNTAIATVTVNALPTVGATGGGVSLCSGATATLSGTGATSYSWSGGITDGAAFTPALGVNTYTVTGSTGSCSNAATATITVNAIPTVGVTGGGVSLCSGTMATLSGTGADSYSWSGSVTNGVAFTPSVGINIYTVTGTNSCGSGTATATVTVNALPTVGTTGGGVAICSGAMATLSGTGASSYGWTGGVTNGVAFTPATGIHSYTVTGTTSGCSNTATTTITVNALPSAGTITGASTVNVGADLVLTDATGAGTWSASNGHATVTGGTVHGVSTGTVTISYSVSSGGCNASATKLVTVGTSTTTTTVAAITGYYFYVCQNSSTPFFDATPGGVWSIDAADAAVASVSASGVVSGISAGTARLSYTVGASAATAVVTVYATPAAISGNPAVCQGMTTTLTETSTGGVWSSGIPSTASIGTNGIVTGVNPGVAPVYYTIPAAGCRAIIMVTVNPNPGGITGATSVCGGSSISLTDATTGGTWSTLSSAISIDGSGSVTGVSTGTGAVTYTLGTGCFKTFNVTVKATPAAISGNTTVCIGAATALTDGTTGGLSWSSSNTSVATVTASGSVTGVTAGTSNITYTLTSGCVAATTVSVTAQPAAITNNSAFCQGSSITLSDVSTGGTWSSNNMAVGTIDPALGSVAGIAAGNATITYALAGAGCRATTVITVNAASTAGSISGTLTVCQGSTTAFTNTVTGGTWSSTATGIATVNPFGVVNGLAQGTATISYTISNICGTVASSVIVTVNPSPVAGTITGTGTVCAGSTTSLTDLTSGGVWTSSAPSVATVGTDGTVTGVTGGMARITYTVTNGCGSAFTTSTVTVNALTAGTISGASSVIAGLTITLSDAVMGGVWSATNANATVSATGVVTGVSAGTVSISYTVTNGCGTIAATQLITVTASSTSGITGTLSVCNGMTTALTDVTPGGTWHSSNTMIATVGTSGIVTAAASGTGTATISYTVGGVPATAVVTVNSNPSGISGSSYVCNGSSVTLNDLTLGGIWTATAGVSVTTGTTATTVTGTAVGSSTVSYTLATGCYKAYPVTVRPQPTAVLGNLNVCGVGGVTFLSDATIPGTSWTISPVSTATVSASGRVYGVAVGTANVTYTAANTCIATAVVTVNALVTVAPILGATNVGHGLTITLSDATAGGVWSSNNPALGSVDATGSVTGVGTSGTVTITYAVSYAGGGCLAYATKPITVHTPAPHEHGTSVSGAVVVNVGTAVSIEDDAIAGTWSSSNTMVAIVDGTGTITGIMPGTANITHIITYDDGELATTITPVMVNALPVDIRIVPNPNNGTFTIKGSIGTLQDEEISLEVTDVLGQVVYKSKTMVHGGRINEDVSIDHTFANGMYMLTVHSVTGNNVFHFVLEK